MTTNIEARIAAWKSTRTTNKTRYSGQMLRSIFVSVVADVEETLSRGKETFLKESIQRRAGFIREMCQVNYIYTKGGGDRGCSGRASLGGGWCRIRIPRNSVNLNELIWLIRHEVYHLFAVRHQDMPNAVNNRGNYGYVEETFSELFTRYGMEVLEAPVVGKKVVSTDEKRAVKLASIETRIAAWESKQKRAENALKKLRQKVRYYQTVMGVAAKDLSPKGR
jgi:hypothetical protein